MPIINEIQQVVEEQGFEVNHYLQEGNQPANKLTSMSHNIETIHFFNSHAELTNHVKGLVNMDR